MRQTSVILLLLLLTGCALWPFSDNADDNLLPEQGFTRMEAEELPEPVREQLENIRTMFVGMDVFYEDRRYILVSYGEQPSGGYNAEITDVTVGDSAVTITVHFTEPEPGSQVTDQITWPRDSGWISERMLPVQFAATGIDTHVPHLIGIDNLPPIVAESRWVKLFEPAPVTTIGNEFTVSGVANVFEGSLLWRLLTVDGNVLVEGMDIAGMGDWYPFEFTVEVPETEVTELALEVFTESAKDGSVENLVTVPLTSAQD
ncbi:MAG: protease complex subunit PrcB family protein [Firmicutes bacterium]|nr:protease complex subunit PrcB family protein [Bacillota bacterium]